MDVLLELVYYTLHNSSNIGVFQSYMLKPDMDFQEEEKELLIGRRLRC